MQNFFQSANENFKDRKDRPTHCTIRGYDYNSGKGVQNPPLWVIEESNTDRDDDWKELDHAATSQFLTAPTEFTHSTFKKNFQMTNFIGISESAKQEETLIVVMNIISQFQHLSILVLKNK